VAYATAVCTSALTVRRGETRAAPDAADRTADNRPVTDPDTRPTRPADERARALAAGSAPRPAPSAPDPTASVSRRFASALRRAAPALAGYAAVRLLGLTALAWWAAAAATGRSSGKAGTSSRGLEPK
jgi:hypothetical protein